MLKRILCVDDEPNVLSALERQFRREFEIHTANGPEIALQQLATEGPFAVVVSDMRMPVMDGAEFLSRVRQSWPETVRIMLTGQADLTSAIAAVNDGKIFQFLTKPCPPEMLSRALHAGVEQHRLVRAERELLEGTLHGAISVLSEILSLVNPVAFGKGHRIQRYVRIMAEHLGLPDRWQYEVAAMLSQIGWVSVPSEVVEKNQSGQALDQAEKEMVAGQLTVARDLLAKIPRLEHVAQIVARQKLSEDDPTLPETVATGMHLLRIALDFDEQMMRGRSQAEIISSMRTRGIYRPAYLLALQTVELQDASGEIRWMKVSQLRPGMVLKRDLVTKAGLVLMGKGQELTPSAVARIHNFARSAGVLEPIAVDLPKIN